jgi:hypothetical protein
MRWLLVTPLFLAACAINSPPRLAALSNQEIAVNQTLEIIVTAIDPDGDSLTFSIDGKPDAATFEATALGARFRWTPIASDVAPGETSQTYPVTFRVDDGHSNRDGETVLITVTRGGPNEGAPVFVSPSDFLLDLSQQSGLDVTVEVQADAAANVSFSLSQAPDGAALAPLGPKSAELTWTPSADQLRTASIFAFTVTADDGVHDPVPQDITVLVRRKPGDSCPGTPPTIVHAALGDQSGPGPYRVAATITDRESAIGSATLFWTRKPNPTSADFASVAMQPDHSAANLFVASIPDLGLTSGQSATVTYFLCASDSDDPAGACNHVTCLPAGSDYFAFVASSGSTTCTEDALDPNRSPSAAYALTAGTAQRSLRLCGGSDDWFKVALTAGQVLDATISFTHANGDLDLDAYAPDGTTLLAQSRQSSATVNEEHVQVTAGAAGTYYLRVYAAAGVANTYDLATTVHMRCMDDAYEPNDSPAQATALNAGTYSGLAICSGNEDWYKIQLHAADNLDVSIDFTNALGDLDLEVYAPDGTTLLGRSDGTTDGESLSFRVLPATGFYYVRVLGYQGAQNTYTLTLSGGQCVDDALEPNDSQSAAVTVSAGTQSGLAICPNNADWFKIALTAGQHLTVTARFKNAFGDLDLKVLKPDGSNLASSVTTMDNEQVDIASVPVTGTYFIEVYSLSGAQNAYDLDVAVTP